MIAAPALLGACIAHAMIGTTIALATWHRLHIRWKHTPIPADLAGELVEVITLALRGLIALLAGLGWPITVIVYAAGRTR